MSSLRFGLFDDVRENLLCCALCIQIFVNIPKIKMMKMKKNKKKKKKIKKGKKT